MRDIQMYQMQDDDFKLVNSKRILYHNYFKLCTVPADTNCKAYCYFFILFIITFINIHLLPSKYNLHKILMTPTIVQCTIEDMPFCFVRMLVDCEHESQFRWLIILSIKHCISAEEDYDINQIARLIYSITSDVSCGYFV